MLFYIAPSVVVQKVYPSSAMVEIKLPEEDDPAIKSYKVNVKNGSADQACTISACLLPLKCQINNLKLATNYLLEVKACVPGDDVCSTTTEENVVITPKGEP